VINWFQYPYVVVAGDFRPPLDKDVFVNRVLHTWDEVDFGLPSVYAPRILDPFYFFVLSFQTLGLSFYISQIIAVFLLYFLAMVLMYVYAKQLTDGNIIASFIAALFLSSNIYLINDREQTAVGFIDGVLMILPCLVTFTESIKKNSFKLMSISALLFSLTYGSFPNYRISLTCLIALALTLLYFFVTGGLKFSYKDNSNCRYFNISIKTGLIFAHLKLLFVFVITILLVSIWIVVSISANYNSLISAYSTMAAPKFALYLEPQDVLRLIAKWGFYEGYVPYANVYLHDPLIIILSYLPPILAFASLVFKKNRLTIFFSGIGVLSLILTSGLNPFFSQIYYGISTYIPLLVAFRESTHWIFFSIISYGILIGVTLSKICHRFRSSKPLCALVLSLAMILLLSTSYPLMNGDVTRNYLRPSIKGSYLPSSYRELNTALSSQYWAVLLPQRKTYVTYNFTEGSFGCGNPYPLLFSKPIISGSGTEYLLPEHSELINKLHELIETSLTRNISPEGKASASSIEGDAFGSENAIDGDSGTRWSSQMGVPQWLETEWNRSRKISSITITFESAYANDYKIEVWNGTGWISQITVESNTAYELQHDFKQPIDTTKIRLYFTKAASFGSVSIYELKVYGYTNDVPKFLGILGIKYLILELNILYGNISDASALKLKLDQVESFVPAKEWDEFTLFENLYALQKIYTADTILNYTTSKSWLGLPLPFDDLYDLVRNLDWDTLKRSTYINLTSPNAVGMDFTSLNMTGDKPLVQPEDFEWKEISPTKYEVHVNSKGPFVLIFLESYDQHWKLYENGKIAPETNHLKVNAFANGWLVDKTGNLTITILYETQNMLEVSVIASIILPALLLTFFNRKTLKSVARIVRNKPERKNQQKASI